MLRRNQMTMRKGIPKHDGNGQLAACVHSHLLLHLRYEKLKYYTSLVPLEIRFHQSEALFRTWKVERM